MALVPPEQQEFKSIERSHSSLQPSDRPRGTTELVLQGLRILGPALHTPQALAPLAVAALAVGAGAIGALAIGRLRVRQASLHKMRIERLLIREVLLEHRIEGGRQSERLW
jgi:hypothetical protein